MDIGGVGVGSLGCADDTVLLAGGPVFLQALLAAVGEGGKPCGMEVNMVRTKSMVMGRRGAVPNIGIGVEGRPVQRVDRVVYLGCMATEDGRCDKEIGEGVRIAGAIFGGVAGILTSGNIGIWLGSRMAKCCAWSALLYGAETWTIARVTTDELEAFGVWLCRRVLRVSRRECRTSGEVLNRMRAKRSLLNVIKKGKCQCFGHIVRGNGVQRLLMEGRINGRRGRGRPRTMWTDNIKEWTEISYNDCIRVA